MENWYNRDLWSDKLPLLHLMDCFQNTITHTVCLEMSQVVAPHQPTKLPAVSLGACSKAIIIMKTYHFELLFILPSFPISYLSIYLSIICLLSSIISMYLSTLKLLKPPCWRHRGRDPTFREFQVPQTAACKLPRADVKWNRVERLLLSPAPTTGLWVLLMLCVVLKPLEIWCFFI